MPEQVFLGRPVEFDRLPGIAAHRFDGFDGPVWLVATAIDQPGGKYLPGPSQSGESLDDNWLVTPNRFFKKGQDGFFEDGTVAELPVQQRCVNNVVFTEGSPILFEIVPSAISIGTWQQTTDSSDSPVSHELDPG